MDLAGVPCKRSTFPKDMASWMPILTGARFFHGSRSTITRGAAFLLGRSESGKLMVRCRNPLLHVATEERDGVRYELTAYTLPSGGFFSEWYCTECDQSGGSLDKKDSAKAAIDLAREDLQSHHADRHKIQ